MYSRCIICDSRRAFACLTIAQSCWRAFSSSRAQFRLWFRECGGESARSSTSMPSSSVSGKHRALSGSENSGVEGIDVA